MREVPASITDEDRHELMWSSVIRRHERWVYACYGPPRKFGPRPNRRVRKWGTYWRKMWRRNKYAMRQQQQLSSLHMWRKDWIKYQQRWLKSATRQYALVNGWIKPGVELGPAMWSEE